METTTIIGLAAGVLTTVANIPQAYKIIKERSTEGVSVSTYIILLTGVALWVAYGIMRDDWPLIIANSISVLTCCIILLLNFTSQQNVDKVHKAVLPEKVQKEAKENS